jgi:indole-3-glycerol phosphate synthase
VAASGISRPEHLARIAAAGFRAALVGSALMARGRPGAALKALLQHGEE